MAGHYSDFSTGKEEQKQVFGATLSEALGHLAIDMYPRLKAHLDANKEVAKLIPYDYSYGTEDFPHTSRR